MLPLSIRKIVQKDNYTFTISWNDGKEVTYRLSDLQRNCPCANCVDEATGKRKSQPANTPDDLRAKSISSVGRYALRIAFSSGCSSGIYGFNELHQWTTGHD